MAEVPKTTSASSPIWPRNLGQSIARLTQAPIHALKTVTRLPQVAAMQAKSAAQALGPAWQAVARQPLANRNPASTPRERQVQADRAFFAANKKGIAAGGVWAGRGRDGALHLMPHASAAAEMFRAVDRSVRIEKGADTAAYLVGAGEGVRDAGRDSIGAMVGLGTAIAHPTQACAALVKAGADRAVVNFSRHSTEVVSSGTKQALKYVADAHKDPRSAGRLLGRTVAELALVEAQTLLLKGGSRLLSGAQGLFRRALPVAEATTQAPQAARAASEVIGTQGERIGASALEYTTYPDKASAKAALEGAQRKAAKDFFAGATGKSQNFKVTNLGDGRYQMEFFSPARNEGYGKRYVQEIGPSGKVIQEYKETMGPNGLINTKWVHQTEGPTA